MKIKYLVMDEGYNPPREAGYYDSEKDAESLIVKIIDAPNQGMVNHTLSIKKIYISG